jgi:hypothetical protein
MRCHPVYVSGQTNYSEATEPITIMALAPTATSNISLAIVKDS